MFDVNGKTPLIILQGMSPRHTAITWTKFHGTLLLSGEPDYFGRNKISSGGDLSHYSSASLY